jgi:hypothetical protein
LIGSPVKRDTKVASAGDSNFEDLISMDDWKEYTEAFTSIPVSV